MVWKYLCAIILGSAQISDAVEVQGHRGSRSVFPENSLASFAAAVESNIDVLELDLQMTRDGVVIIYHDYFLNTELCADLSGKLLESDLLVRHLNLSQIKQVDCGCRGNRAFPEQKKIIGTQIPTLEELFQMIEKSAYPHAKVVRLNLELKRDPRHSEWSAPPDVLATAVVKLVERYGFSSRVYYSSFDPESLGAIRNVAPKATLGLIFNEESLKEAAKQHSAGGMQFLLKIASTLGVDVLSPEHVLLKTAEDVKRYQHAGVRVVTWTVNDQRRWKELLEMGVDGIITDHPAQLKEYLKTTP